MCLRPPSTIRTDPLLPDTTLFRSVHDLLVREGSPGEIGHGGLVGFVAVDPARALRSLAQRFHEVARESLAERVVALATLHHAGGERAGKRLKEQVEVR